MNLLFRLYSAGVEDMLHNEDQWSYGKETFQHSSSKCVYEKYRMDGWMDLLTSWCHLTVKYSSGLFTKSINPVNTFSQKYTVYTIKTVYFSTLVIIFVISGETALQHSPFPYSLLHSLPDYHHPSFVSIHLFIFSTC